MLPCKCKLITSPVPVTRNMPSPSCHAVDHSFVESIPENSCLKCNDLTDPETTTADPLFRSTCHDLQCQKVGKIPRITGAEEVVKPLLPPVLNELDINDLPPELLNKTFEYLDYYSLYRAGSVCTRWRDLIQRIKKHQRTFERAFDELWAHQFREIYPVMDYAVFSELLDSVNCTSCFFQEPETSRTVVELPLPNANLAECGVRRLKLELKGFPCEGVHAIPVKDKTTKLIARIQGPKDSPFENGIFYLSVSIKNIAYPFRPPEIRFLTKIFHPAISCHGHISVDIFGAHQWTPSYSLPKVLLSIQSLLTDTDFELCEHTPIGKLYKENQGEYERIARIWTEKFAMQHLIHPVLPPAPPVVAELPGPPPNDI